MIQLTSRKKIDIYRYLIIPTQFCPDMIQGSDAQSNCLAQSPQCSTPWWDEFRISSWKNNISSETELIEVKLQWFLVKFTLGPGETRNFARPLVASLQIAHCPCPHRISVTYGVMMSSIPSGKHTKNYGKSPFVMGKSIIMGVMMGISWEYSGNMGKLEFH